MMCFCVGAAQQQWDHCLHAKQCRGHPGKVQIADALSRALRRVPQRHSQLSKMFVDLIIYLDTNKLSRDARSPFATIS
jgi:hypothetical protein